MRKLYAFFAGIVLTLFATRSFALPVTPDVAYFNSIVNDTTRQALFLNHSVLGDEPGSRKAYWDFGDGTVVSTLPLQGTQHLYSAPGAYNVCLRIYRYRSTPLDSVLSAIFCRTIVIHTICKADFERIVSPTSAPLTATYRALPWINSNAKPFKICWTFGDGRDTCINYPNAYNGQYIVTHRYLHAGIYEVCVNISYDGGCVAHKCRNITIERPDTCGADFERIPVASNPLLNYFKALPQHNNNRKPARVCWRFGDGSDTCINYAENYTGLYVTSHRYDHAGLYEVCVNILYYGGCEASKCHNIQVGRPDTCAADFERIQSTANILRTYFRALPQHNNNRKPSRVCWRFGDGRDTCINYPETFTGQYVVSHEYAHAGLFEVCVNILYFGGCEATKCHNIQVGRPDTCGADFERIVSSTAAPLRAYFKALPQHNNNRKPSRVCWRFGDGNDTCIEYSETFTGQYVVAHNYAHPGTYEVCVRITYYGGCEATKCHNIIIGQPDTCSADFERIPSSNTAPLLAYFRALPSHNNNSKPSRICWRFGDGTDTCINYTSSYTGQYVVSHRYNQPGNYEVCVNILYFGGCEARNCHMVLIGTPPPACSVRLFEITPSITSLVRGFLAVPLSGATPPARPVRVCWYFGDGQDTCIMIDPAQPVPTLIIRHTYPAPGTYRACVSVLFQGGCIAYDCKEVVIRALSNICGGYMTDSLTGPRTFKFKGFSIHDPNDEVVSYRWTFGDGTTATGQEVTHQFTNGGNFNVCLYIVTRLGCETRICKTVRVPGNNEPQLHLSPNPVTTTINVDFFSTHTETVNIRILNNNGTVVRSYTRNVTVGANNWSYDLTTLLPGLYSFIVQSPNQLASALFIKQ